MGNHLLQRRGAGRGRLAARSSPGYWRDEFGVVWNRTVDPDIGVIEDYQFGERSLAGYRFPDPAAPARWEGTRARRWSAAATATPSAPSASRSSSAPGPARHGEPADGHGRGAGVRGRAARRHLRLQRGASSSEAVKYDIDAVLLRRRLGPAARPDHGADAVAALHQAAPRSACTARSRQRGKFVIIHSCGKVQELFPELIEIGLDFFNPFQPEVMDVVEMKRQYGDRLTFLGGVSTQKVLPYGTPDDVRRRPSG